jgi:predicted acyltransferase
MTLKPPELKTRHYSLDVFRGATVAFMILVNNPGNWSYLYSPLDHATWHGCTPTDLVFPFFLFAVGNAMAFGMPALKNGLRTRFWRKVGFRALLIFLIGLLLNWSPFVRWENDSLILKPLSSLRFFGVLQRIALAYFFSAILIYHLGLRQLLVSLTGLLTGYWLLTFFLGTAGSPYSLEGFIGTNIDRRLFGNDHLYKGEGVPFDPEGLFSTIGAVSQVIIGYLVGRYILLKGAGYKLATYLFAAGAVLTAAGFTWDLFYPVNKKIWTSSYVLYTSGLAITLLALLIVFIEIPNYKGKLTRFFEVFGKNPLFIFVLSGVLPRTLSLIRIPAMGGKWQSPFSWFYQHVCQPVFISEYNASLVYALVMVAMYWCIGFWLDKKRIYVKV